MRGSNTVWLTFFLLLFSANVLANNNTPPKTIAYIDHPLAEPYKAFLRQSYRDANQEVKFVVMPATRRFIQANKGNVDAIGAATESAVFQYKNLKKVPVVLGKATLKLMCFTAAPCNENVLVDVNSTLFTTIGIFALLEEELNKKVTAEKYTLESFKQLIELVNAGKVKYLVASNLSEKSMDITPDYSSLILGEYFFYHFVHSSNTSQIPDLTAAFKKNIKQLEKFINY